MITILHGENIQESRNELNRLKSTYRESDIRFVDGKRADENILRQATESSSLFGEPVTVIIEQLFAPIGKKQKTIKAYAAILSEAGKENTIIIWENKELGKTVLSGFPNANVRFFPLPKTLFSFLDGIKPNNQRQTFAFLERALETQAPELLFFMLTVRIRQLIQAKDGIMPEKTSAWQYARLTNQAKFFTMEQLRTMHTNLLSIETSIKSGTTPFTMKQHIQEFLLEY